MNTHIDIDQGRLRVTLHGLDVVWTTRRRMIVPLAHVVGARLDPYIHRRGPWLGAGRTDRCSVTPSRPARCWCTAATSSGTSTIPRRRS